MADAADWCGWAVGVPHRRPSRRTGQTPHLGQPTRGVAGLHDHSPARHPGSSRPCWRGMVAGEADHLPATGRRHARCKAAVPCTAGCSRRRATGRPFTDRLPRHPSLGGGPFVPAVPPAQLAASARSAIASGWRRPTAGNGRERPEWEAPTRCTAEVDLASASPDDDLVAHLRSARPTPARATGDHFRLHGTDLSCPRRCSLTLSADRVASTPAPRPDSWRARHRPRPVPRGLSDWALVTGYDLDERASCTELPPRPCPRRTRSGAEVVVALEPLVGRRCRSSPRRVGPAPRHACATAGSGTTTAC